MGKYPIVAGDTVGNNTRQKREKLRRKDLPWMKAVSIINLMTTQQLWHLYKANEKEKHTHMR